MLKIGVFSGTRAEYGLLKHLIQGIDADKNLKLQLYISGSHLSEIHGKTINEVLSDGIKPTALIPISLDETPPKSMSYLTSEVIVGFEKAINKFGPSLIILLGDRYETFAAAVTAHLLQIPIAHIHGGETTLGAIDDKLRHAITQLSSWHFTACDAYKNKIISMGIPEKKIFNVGPMIIDGILKNKMITRLEFEKETGYKFAKKNLLVTYHPETLCNENGLEGFKSLIRSISEVNCNVLFTSPNADKGGDIILNYLIEFVSSNTKKYFHIKSLGQKNYINALRLFDGVAGNSSSGIIEAPIVNVPVLNIGNRQSGRIRFGKVLDVSSDYKEVSNGLKIILKSKELSIEEKKSFNDLQSPSLKILNWIKAKKKY